MLCDADVVPVGRVALFPAVVPAYAGGVFFRRDQPLYDETFAGKHACEFDEIVVNEIAKIHTIRLFDWLFEFDDEDGVLVGFDFN